MGATMTVTEDHSILTSGPDAAELQERLTAGADDLAAARRSILANPRVLVVTSASLMTLGVTSVLLGWAGASHSTFIEEQVPYLISGGLLGVSLSTIGALLFFTHWLTVGIKEARAHEASRRQDHEDLLAAVRSLGEAFAAGTQGGGTNGDAGSAQPGRPVRRAPRGS